MKSINFLVIFLLIVSSKAKADEVILWVNSYLVNCVGVGPMKCLLVQKSDTIVDNQWQNFYSKIEGFDYEPGFIYKLRVKEETRSNVPADASSLQYTLIEVLAKEADMSLRISGKWEAIKLESKTIVIPEERGAIHPPTIILNVIDRTVSGIDGCNRLSGQIEHIRDTEIKFGAIAETRMMCPDMSIPQQFNRLLNEVRNYELNTDELNLLDECGNELISFVRMVDPETIVVGKWELIKLGEQLLETSGQIPRLEIDKELMAYFGMDGCNHFRGKILKLTGEELELSPTAGTRRMCPDMKVADAFNLAISQVKYYQPAGSQLLLKDTNKVTLLVLQRAR